MGQALIWHLYSLEDLFVIFGLKTSLKFWVVVLGVAFNALILLLDFL